MPMVFVPNEITIHGAVYQALSDTEEIAWLPLLSEYALLCFLSCYAILYHVVTKGFVVIFYQIIT